MKYKEKEKGIMALLALSFVFACMGIFARFLNQEFTILQQTYLRIFMAFLLGVIMFNKDLDIKKLRKITPIEWGVIFLRSISLYAIGVTFISEAYVTTKYANTSLLSALPMTAILGFLFLRERFTLKKMLYIILGFIGVFLIVIQDNTHVFSWERGDIFALSSSVFFALSYIARKWHTSLLNNKEIAVIIFFVSSILLFMTSLLIGQGIPKEQSFTGFMIFILIVSGLFNVANLYLTNYGFQKIQAVLASNLLMTEVLFAVVIGVGFYKESILFKELLGGAIIIFSAYQMNKLSE